MTGGERQDHMRMFDFFSSGLERNPFFLDKKVGVVGGVPHDHILHGETVIFRLVWKA